MNALAVKISSLYEMSAVKRSLVIIIAFQVILWAVFTVAYLLNQNAWGNDIELVFYSGSVIRQAFAIFGRNMILFVLILAGNMFVRFGAATPGLLILIVQGILIGGVAGSNAFEFPFATVLDANIQYLKVGLWETLSYSLICGVTLNKSLYIAESFPAKEWSQVRKFNDLKFTTAEKLLALLSLIFLGAAAYIEAVLVSGL